MITVLRVLLLVLGVSAVAICLSIVLLGPSFTAGFSEAQFDWLTGSKHPATGPWPATMDNEMRFYAPFWGAYGLVLLTVARDLPKKLGFVPPLSALFFVGGVGRAISWGMVGPPHPFFSLLMAIELILPVVFMALWFGARR
jgi:Domain of unknown function (DUF4345)